MNIVKSCKNIPSAALVLAACAVALGVGGCDSVGTSGNAVVGKFSAEELPILPGGFPVYPKSLSAAGLNTVAGELISGISYRQLIEGVEGGICQELDLGFTSYDICLDDILTSTGLYQEIDEAINSTAGPVYDLLMRAINERLSFFNPGPLTMAVNQQIASIFQNRIVITDVSLDLTLTNHTDQLWPTPICFILYLGDAEGVAKKTAKVLQNKDDLCTARLEPGQSATIHIDQIDSLVNALNEFHSLGIDYDADIDLIESAENVDKLVDWFAAAMSDDNDNGIADGLATWKIGFDDFRLTLAGEGRIELPVEIPEWLDRYLEP